MTEQFMQLGGLRVKDLSPGDNFEIIHDNKKIEAFIKSEDFGELTLAEDVEGKRCYFPSGTYVLI